MLRLPIAIFIVLLAHALHANSAPTSDNASQASPSDMTYSHALSSWSAVLSQYVDSQGRTDFIALAENTQDLQQVVDFIASTSPQSHPELFPRPADVLAYHINTYNALAMHNIIEAGIPKNFKTFFKRASFFKFRRVIIGGKKTSLYDYENKVIRKLDDPRLHFALNCMVRDCPRLPQEPFLADTLDQQLDAVTYEFFSKPKHFRLDAEAGVVYLSWILDAYTKDFVSSGKARDLVPYVNQYLTTAIPADYKVRFIKYDWTVNQQP